MTPYWNPTPERGQCAIRSMAPSADCDAVEIMPGLCQRLEQDFPGVNVICSDFLQYAPAKCYSRIFMTPPSNIVTALSWWRRGPSVLRPPHATAQAPENKSGRDAVAPGERLSPGEQFYLLAA